MQKWDIKFSPRKWQQEAFDIWREVKKGIVSVVTGGGKTALAELCISHFLKLLITEIS
jgi:superfamily II DNA or RNA helicase